MPLCAFSRTASRAVRVARCASCFVGGLALLAPAWALGPEAGEAPGSALPYADQSQVNVLESGYQGSATVAALADGGWIVLWIAEEAGNYVIRARRHQRDGTPASAEWSLTAAPTIGPPEIARLDDGRFVALWVETAAALVEGVSLGIHGRFLDSTGHPDGDSFTAHATSNAVRDLDVASSPGGGFVVAWHDLQDIWLRRFDASGAPLAPEQIANTLGGVQQAPHIARLESGGGHVVVWTSWTSGGSDNDGASVQWRRLAASGAFAGPESQANSFTPGEQQSPDVAALSGGGFAIAWQSVPPPAAGANERPDGEPIGNGIDLRFFHATGMPVSPEVTVSSGTGLACEDPALRRAPDGDLLVVWTGDANGSVRALRTAPWPHGIIVGELAIDNFPGATGHEYPKAGIGAEGDFAVVWGSYGASPGGDSSDGSVQLRTFTTGRVAHWRFEESSGPVAFDDAGLQADDANLSGGGDPEWSWGRPGQGALAFSGAGLANVPSSSDFDLGCCSVTVTAWLYLETLLSNLVEPYASIYDAAEDNYVLYLDRDLAELRFKVTNGLGNAERPGIPEAMLPLRRWFHVAGVYRGDGSASIYLDGVLADTHINANLTGPVRSSPPQVAAIGRDGVNDRYYLDGRIDDIEVWRRGLTDDEIRLARGPWLFGDGFERGDTLDWSSSQP